MNSHNNRPIELKKSVFCIVAFSLTALLFSSTASFAQEGSTEPPPPEPILEETDDIVIPDDEDEIEEQSEEQEAPDVIEEVELVVDEDPTDKELAAQAKQMKEALGQAVLKDAQAAAAAGKWREAANKYFEANQYIPNNPVILQGLQEAYSMLDQGSLLDAYEQRMSMERESARAMFDARINAGNDRLLREDFDNARREVQNAISRLEQDDRRLFSEVELNQRLQSAKSLLAQIELQHEEWQQQRLMREATERSHDQAARQSEESRKRDQLILDNLKRVRQLQLEQKFEQAIEIVNEILFIDEHNIFCFYSLFCYDIFYQKRLWPCIDTL